MATQSLQQLFMSLTGVALFASSYALARGAVQASLGLHGKLLTNCLRSPMLFFDTTPIGRLLNRFSKDIDGIDTVIPKTLQSWLHTFLKNIATLIVISMSTPLFATVIIPLGLFYVVIQEPDGSTDMTLLKQDNKAYTVRHLIKAFLNI